MENIYKIFVKKQGKPPVGRLGSRQEDNIKPVFKEI
jgi:hypothetical protein